MQKKRKKYLKFNNIYFLRPCLESRKFGDIRTNIFGVINDSENILILDIIILNILGRKLKIILNTKEFLLEVT